MTDTTNRQVINRSWSDYPIGTLVFSPQGKGWVRSECGWIDYAGTSCETPDESAIWALLPPAPPSTSFGEKDYITEWESRQRALKESRQRAIDDFIKMGMHRKTAKLLAYNGVKSVDDINLLGESGLTKITYMGPIRMNDIRRALGWPDPIKPLYASLNAEAMANELRRRGWHVVRGTD